MEAKALKQRSQPSKWGGYIRWAMLIILLVYVAWLLLPQALKVHL